MHGRIGLIGGSFDPVHFGHLLAAEGAAERLGLEKVIFIPAKQPPHKPYRHLASFQHRYAMVKIAVRGNPKFDVSDVEMRRGGKSYSIDTIHRLRAEYGMDSKLFFIVGADMIPDLPTWKDIKKLVQLCSFAVAVRPGYDVRALEKLAVRMGSDFVRETKRHIIQIPPNGISATEIRRRLRLGKSIRYMMPEEVERYIRRNRLYGT
jgi:nicotinate-nucleotide adenylyltransferase